MERTVPQHTPNLLDYWRIVCRFRWLILGLVVSSMLVTGVVSKLSPKRYVAKVTVFQAKEEAMGGGISFGGGGKEKGGGGSGFGMTEALGGSKSGPSPMEILQAILLSRGMAEAVIAQLNLMQYYGTESKNVAVAALQAETDVKPNRFKMIEIAVESKDPQVAADIANAYALNLDILNQDLNITSVKQHRLFVEARLAEKTKQLAEVEEALRAFQAEHRVLEMKEHTMGALQSAAALHGQIVGLEVELAALKAYATPSHPMINQLQVQIQELRRQLDMMELQQVDALGAHQRARTPMSKKFFPAFEEAPSLVLDLTRLMRRVKVEESVYGMLVGALEQAKISESKDLPTVQVLDPALPPQHKSRPKTLHNMLAAGALSLVLGLFLAFFLTHVETLRAEGAASVLLEEGAVPASEVNGNGDRLEAYPNLVSPQETERLHGPT